jgi:hypothetical protein
MLPSATSISALVGPKDSEAAVPSCLRFCITWFVGVVLLIAVIGTFNAVIDPYLIIGTPRIAGLNAAKPEARWHTQLAKDYLIGRVRPAGLLLGTSKVDIGIDPQSQFWPEDARPAFNYGVPGTDIRGNLADLRRALALGPIRRVLVVLEFGDFMTLPSTEKAALAASTTKKPIERLQDIALATLSMDALRDSIMTVIAQHRPDPIDLSPEGATNDQLFRKQVRVDGYETFFLQKDTETGGRLAGLSAALRAHPDVGLANLDQVAAMIALCRQHGVDLDFALPPTHADLLVQIDRAGLWSRYHGVKAALTRLIAANGGGAARLWDFSGFDAVSTEPVPTTAEAHADTRWFWEPNHFKRAVGERMLAAIYGGVAGFGVLLTPRTIGAHLSEETVARDRWMAGNIGGWRERLARAARM